MMKTMKPEVQELIEQGKVLYSLDKYEQAITYFQKALKLDQYCEAIYENMSMCYIMMDQYDCARQILNKYLLLNKKSGAAHFHLGNIALLENKVAEARAYYSKAELLGFTNPAMFVNLASFYEETNEIEKALEQYNKILRGNPYDYAVMERKTQLLFRVRRFSEALQSAKAMVQTDIDAFEGHNLVYTSLIMLNRYDEAGAYLEELTLRFPGNRAVLFDQARLYDLKGEPDKALDVLEKNFTNIQEDSRLALLKLGLFLQKRQTDEAMNLIEHSSALQKEATALTMMYSMYFAKGNYSKAIEYCNRIQALGEENSQYYATWYFKPLAQKRMGKEEQAKKDFTEASMRLREVTLKLLTKVDLNMYRALCEYQLGNFKEAQKLIEYLLAVKDDVAAFHLVAAAVYKALNQPEEAGLHIEKANRLDPNAVAPLM